MSKDYRHLAFKELVERGCEPSAGQEEYVALLLQRIDELEMPIEIVRACNAEKYCDYKHQEGSNQRCSLSDFCCEYQLPKNEQNLQTIRANWYNAVECCSRIKKERDGFEAKIKELEAENARLRESSSSQDYNGSMVNPFNKD